MHGGWVLHLQPGVVRGLASEGAGHGTPGRQLVLPFLFFAVLKGEVPEVSLPYSSANVCSSSLTEVSLPYSSANVCSSSLTEVSLPY